MRILLDMDGITVDFFGPLLAEYYKRTGEYVRLDQITEWDMGSNVTNKQALFEIFHEPGFFERLPPMPGAIKAIQELIHSGHEVVIVSSPCTSHAASEKINWCKQYLPFIDPKNIILCHHNNKHTVMGDVLIDDNADTAQKYVETHPNSMALTLAYAYNNVNPNPYTLRAEGALDTCWSQIEHIIKLHSYSFRSVED